VSAAELESGIEQTRAGPAMPAPRVSVLMTIYNAGPYLSKSIDSLIGQSFHDWELIAVEDGSSDDSAATLARYADNARLRPFFLKSNIGRTPALRYAFSQARGEYIAVLDADDLAHPERLRKQVDHLDSHPETVLLGTWADYIDARDAVVGKCTPPTEAAALVRLMASENPILHSSAMYRAAVASEVGGYPEHRPYNQDYGLWLRLVVRGSPAMLAERLTHVRILSSSMTRSRKQQVQVAGDILQAMLDAGETLNLCEDGKRLNRQAVAIARLRYAVALARSRRLAEGLRAACRALTADPVSIVNNRITRSFFRR
jgi:glycosyltransferase involved in cell wall biosynthesis